MQLGGPSDVGENVGSDGASSRPPTQSVHEHDIVEHAESGHAQYVQGLARGPPLRRGAPPQFDPATLMASMATLLEGQVVLQESLANLTTLLERQSIAINHAVTPPLVVAPPKPLVPPPPPQEGRGGSTGGALIGVP